MKYFYISSKKGISGISKYSHDFFELVLKEKGYEFIDSHSDTSVIFTTISSRDHVHIEIGIFQKREIELLFLMIKASYRNISITLHDAPLLKYPFKEFKNSHVNRISKFYDRFIIRFKNAIPYIQKVKSIYVLSQRGVEVTKKVYKTDKVYYLPHIVNPKEIQNNHELIGHFLYFGFIGKNKGVEYSLKLHEALLKVNPEVQFYVIGTALGKQVTYFEYLKGRYKQNVHFMGYVQENELAKLYAKASFAIFPFKEYDFFHPMSGSILHSLKKGKIILTNNVNTISEIITDRENGLFLTGELKKDIKLVLEVMNNERLFHNIQQNIFSYLEQSHYPAKVAEHFME